MGVQRRGVWYDISGHFTVVGCLFFYGESAYIRDISRDDAGEEEDSRTEIIYAQSEIGTMVDFLKANPFVSMDDYKWKLSVPMIKIMCADNTHVNYLTEKQLENRKSIRYDGSKGGNLNDLGIPIIGLNNN